MRAILVDPDKRSLSEVDCTGKLEDIKRLMQIDSPIDVIVIDPTETIYIDDEGLLKLNEGDAYAVTRLPSGAVIAGKMLIIGCDDEGDSAPTKLSLTQASPWFRFERRQFQGWKPGYEDTVDHPIMGPKTPRYVGPQPIWGPDQPLAI